MKSADFAKSGSLFQSFPSISADMVGIVYVGGDGRSALLSLRRENLLQSAPRNSTPFCLRSDRYNPLAQLRISQGDEYGSVITHVLPAFLMDYPRMIGWSHEKS
ncbi:hypothetical protein NTA18_04995, partial [Pseudomonas aeruginosa]|nr:hypothetical protein [Pseudomonas aeruginosa]